MDANRIAVDVLQELEVQGGPVGWEARAQLRDMKELPDSTGDSTFDSRTSCSRLRFDLRHELEQTMPDLGVAYEIQQKLRANDDDSAEIHFLTAILFLRAIDEQLAGRGVPPNLSNQQHALALELSYAMTLDDKNPEYRRACNRILDTSNDSTLITAIHRAGIQK